MPKCDFCKREVDYEELVYDIDDTYEWYGEISVCKRCAPKIKWLIQQMKALNVNPEIHPLEQRLEYIYGKDYKRWLQERGEKVEFSPYDSNYTSFEISEAGARMRKMAIDEMLKIKDKNKRHIVEKLIEEIDGTVAEALMLGSISPCTVAIEAMYEVALIVAMSIEDWE